jgi:hypothetical protein
MMSSLDNQFQCVRIASQFAKVSPSEFAPLLWIVSKPATQRGARGYILKPCFKRPSRFLDPSGPKPLNEKTRAVSGVSCVIGTFQFDN